MYIGGKEFAKMKRKALEKEFEDYIIRHKEAIYRLAYSYVRNSDDALDMVQESIYKAFTSLDSLKDFGAIKTWFYRIVVNTCLDFIRIRGREIVAGQEYLIDNSPGASDSYSDIDLNRALGELPDNYRGIIVLRYFEDLQLNQIAQVLDININTVKTRLYRGLDLLRIEMEMDGQEV